MKQSEAAVWEAFKQGSKAALDEMYQSSVRSLYAYGCKLTTDTALVEDCIQDMFVEIWEKRKSLGATTSYKFYLFKTLRRKIIHNLSSKKHGDFADHIIPIREESHEFQLVLDQTHTQRKIIIQEAIDSLSIRQKEAIYLRFYDDLSFDEVAEVMNIDVKSVYKMIYKALDGLRNHMPSKNTLIDTLLILLIPLFFI